MFKYMLLSLFLMTACSANSMGSWFKRSKKVSPSEESAPNATGSVVSAGAADAPVRRSRLSPTSVRISDVIPALSPVSAALTAAELRNQSMIGRLVEEGVDLKDYCSRCGTRYEAHLGGSKELALEWHQINDKLLELSRDPANKAQYSALEARQLEIQVISEAQQADRKAARRAYFSGK